VITGVSYFQSSFQVYCCPTKLINPAKKVKLPPSHFVSDFMWLQSHNISVDLHVTKQEPLETVKWNKQQPVWTVNRILREKGFIVL
jgi:hypothetical protein